MFKKLTHPTTKANAQENKQIAKFTMWMMDQILQSYCLERMILTRSYYETIPKLPRSWGSIAIDTLNDR